MKERVRALLADQRLAGAVAFGLAALSMSALMARHGHTHWGVGLGLLADCVAALGVVGMLGMLRESEATPPPAEPPTSGAAPYRGEPIAPGPSADEPPRLTPAMIVLALGAILLLPDLGFGLWDPWETHYGEVAREIIARDDWISLWWQDEWFWSKPILLFWMSAVAMGVLGVRAGPDGGAP